MYFWPLPLPVALASSHLVPVEKPAPPRPLRPDRLTSSMIHSGSLLRMAFSAAA